MKDNNRHRIAKFQKHEKNVKICHESHYDKFSSSFKPPIKQSNARIHCSPQNIESSSYELPSRLFFMVRSHKNWFRKINIYHSMVKQ